MRYIVFTFLTMCLTTLGHAQSFPFNERNWVFNSGGHIVETYQGKQALYLFQGTAELSEVDFFTGTIEFKIFGTGRRGFPGVQWRVQPDKINYEEFYARFHQSGNPDANQYTPVFNGISAWQLYYGEQYSTPVVYKVNDWNHIKVVIAERQAEVYINNMNEPVLFISELKHTPTSGKIRFTAGGPSAFHFADLKIEKVSTVTLKGKAKARESMPTNAITQWSVSKTFSSKKIEGKTMLDSDLKKQVWTTLAVEDKGYANLSRLSVWSEETNTVFARVIIESETVQVKKLTYGFSDHVRVFLNDQILTEGMDYNSSRDYRFLGTAGYYDAVYLNLKKGRNELWMAVSEDLGGWGIMAYFENLDGIKINP